MQHRCRSALFATAAVAAAVVVALALPGRAQEEPVSKDGALAEAAAAVVHRVLGADSAGAIALGAPVKAAKRASVDHARILWTYWQPLEGSPFDPPGEQVGTVRWDVQDEDYDYVDIVAVTLTGDTSDPAAIRKAVSAAAREVGVKLDDEGDNHAGLSGTRPGRHGEVFLDMTIGQGIVVFEFEIIED